jgi:hypothetical protein
MRILSVAAIVVFACLLQSGCGGGSGASGVGAPSEGLRLSVPQDVLHIGDTQAATVERVMVYPTVAAKVLSRCKGVSEGVAPTAGTLLFGESKTVVLAIVGATKTVTFGRAFLRGDWDLNKGSRYSMLVLEFECHKDADGKIWTEAANPAG